MQIKKKKKKRKMITPISLVQYHLLMDSKSVTGRSVLDCGRRYEEKVRRKLISMHRMKDAERRTLNLGKFSDA